MELSERIKEMASKQGLNIKTLEINAGLGNGTIRRWGTSPPSVDKLLKIANLLNTTMDFLMTGETENILSTLPHDDAEWLSLIKRLPEKKRNEFKIRIEGYLECYEESVAADTSLKKSGTDNPGKSLPSNGTEGGTRVG